MGIYHCLCKRCGHEWDPVGRDWPRKCPNCQSVRWGSGYWTAPTVKLSVDTKCAPVPTKLVIGVKR